MRNKRLDIIICPYCNREYLPAEIFVPKAFFGKPTYVDRDYTGKIIDFYGTTLDTRESYICDGCNNTFKIFTNVKFSTAKDNKNSFEEEYTTELKKKDLLEFPEN